MNISLNGKKYNTKFPVFMYKVPVPSMDTLRKMYFFSSSCTRHRTPKMHDHYSWTVDYSYKKLATLLLLWFNLNDNIKKNL